VIGSSILVCKKGRAIERRVVAAGGERKRTRGFVVDLVILNLKGKEGTAAKRGTAAKEGRFEQTKAGPCTGHSVCR
jgi:hypothetical protein